MYLRVKGHASLALKIVTSILLRLHLEELEMALEFCKLCSFVCILATSWPIIYHIDSFPHMDIPSKPAYGVYISQLVRIGRICDNYNSFFTRHHQLTCRLVKKGFLYDKLVTNLKIFCNKYPDIFSKFKISIRKHVEDGICLPTVAISSLSSKVSIRSKTDGILNSWDRRVVMTTHYILN